MNTNTKKRQQTTPSRDDFQEISETLRQCNTCKKFIKGSKWNFNRHFKTHRQIITYYHCLDCEKDATSSEFTAERYMKKNLQDTKLQQNTK